MSESGLHSVSSQGSAGGATCPNCGDARSGAFCAVCGQNDRNYVRGLGSVGWDLCRESFEVDSRLLQTLKLLLFKPGSLTTEFSRNRRARYMSPVRLYLFASFLFVLVLSFAMPDSLSEGAVMAGADPEESPLEGDVAPGGGQEVSTLSKLSDAELEVLRAALRPGQSRRLDDILGRPDDDASKIAALVLLASLVSAEDPARPNLLVRMFLTSIVDLLHDPDVFVQRVIGNLPIAMFFLLPFLGLAVAVCYFRKKRFFVEHLVFGMHNQTFTFLCLAAALLTSAGPIGRWFRLFFIFVPQVYYLIALRRYYRDGWIWTLIKGFAVWWLYLAFLLPGFFLVLFLTA